MPGRSGSYRKEIKKRNPREGNKKIKRKNTEKVKQKVKTFLHTVQGKTSVGVWCFLKFPTITVSNLQNVDSKIDGSKKDQINGHYYSWLS